jgi:hypothetical protein
VCDAVERNHDSALARFLLYRGLHNRTLVGHYLFWHFKAAINGSSTDQRYLALIQALFLLLSFCMLFFSLPLSLSLSPSFVW